MRKVSGILLLCVIATGCKEHWNPEDERAFYTACTDEAKNNWAKTDSLARIYCECIFDKMAVKYPEEEDMLEHIDKLAKDTGLINCKSDVLEGRYPHAKQP